VEVSVSNAGAVVLLATSTGDSALLSAAPYTFEYTIPNDAVGTITIGALARDGTGFIGSDEVVIQTQVSAELTGIQIEPHPESGAATVTAPAGLGLPLTVTGVFGDGVTRDLTPAAAGTTYATSNPAVLEVSADGVVTGKAPGTATVTVSNRGVPASVRFTMENGYPDLAIAIAHGPLAAGKHATYTLTVSSVGFGPTTADIRVTDSLGPDLTFDSATGDGWQCGAVGATVTCTRSAPLDAGASTAITLGVVVSPQAPARIDTSATVSSTGDIDVSNDTAVNSARAGSQLPGDVDGDGKSDAAVWRGDSGTWYVRHSATDGATYTGVQWGVAAFGDKPVPGDYDGDGKMDIAVWRPSSGTWYVLKSSDNYSYSSYIAVQWGSQAEGDVPVPGDYDGDGKADPAIWRPSSGTWYWLRSRDNYGTYGAVQWGNQAAGDVPVGADFDGDGTLDPAVWRPSTGTWYWLRSRDGYNYATYGAVQWGAGGDTPVQGDYDGDGSADLAIWRPTDGSWYVLKSSDSYSYATYLAVKWGDQASGDVPMPGDYDGDGRMDLAVWRASTGVWYALKSSDGYSYSTYMTWQWGGAGDAPVRR
jgi:hypothetical protein